MPASRILEGSLPEQHPRAQIFSGAQTQPKTQQSGISRASPLAGLVPTFGITMTYSVRLWSQAFDGNVGQVRHRISE